jgi:hypothetical protein
MWDWAVESSVRQREREREKEVSEMSSVTDGRHSSVRYSRLQNVRFSTAQSVMKTGLYSMNMISRICLIHSLSFTPIHNEDSEIRDLISEFELSCRNSVLYDESRQSLNRELKEEMVGSKITIS